MPTAEERARDAASIWRAMAKGGEKREARLWGLLERAYTELDPRVSFVYGDITAALTERDRETK